MHQHAVISACGKYRYWLTREWDRGLPVAVFIMLNPSTADAEQDDPTIRRCKGFARQWGCGAISVVNLFAYRTTDPKVLRDTIDFISEPIEPQRNWNHILMACEGQMPGSKNLRHVYARVAAWGANRVAEDIGKMVWRHLKIDDMPLSRLGVTKDGYPRHPLYAPSDSVLTIWKGE